MKNLLKPNYRPDIDGLRALAVLSVLAFHAFPELVPGGFIGVDIFFVISGFLITRLLLKNLKQGSFSFQAFYAARVLRLFPSLILVLLTCLIFGWMALLSDELRALGKHITATAIFVPNFAFWSESGYFDYAASTKPLLHLWSLGVEEQFYFVWPLIVWAGFRCKANIARLGIAFCLASFAFNLVWVQEAMAKAFFSPLSRMWEPLLGCILACVVDIKMQEYRDSTTGGYLLNQRLRSTASVIGLALILTGMFVLDADTEFPGSWALLPALGTGLIIFGSERAWVNQSLFSQRWLVSIGLISYPLYLWHWPLLSFTRVVEGGRPDWSIAICLLLIAFILAFLTYRFIERPIRNGQRSSLKALVLVAMLIAVGLVGLLTFLRDGFPSRISNKTIEMQLADLKFDIPDGTEWYCRGAPGEGPRCHSTGPKPTVVVLGDSHALTIYSGLQELFQARGKTIGLYGASDGCPPLLDVVIQDQGGEARNCLIKGSKAIKRVLADPLIEEVMLTSRGPMYTTGEGFGEIERDQFGSWALHFEGESKGSRTNEEVFATGLAKTLDALTAAGKKITFLHDVPELGFDIRSCFSFRPMTFSKSTKIPCAVSRKEFEIRSESYRSMVNSILRQRPEIKVIDLADALCDQQWCWAEKNGALFYIDDDHLSHQGAKYVIDRLRDKF